MVGSFVKLHLPPEPSDEWVARGGAAPRDDFSARKISRGTDRATGPAAATLTATDTSYDNALEYLLHVLR